MGLSKIVRYLTLCNFARGILCRWKLVGGTLYCGVSDLVPQKTFTSPHFADPFLQPLIYPVVDGFCTRVENSAASARIGLRRGNRASWKARPAFAAWCFLWETVGQVVLVDLLGARRRECLSEGICIASPAVPGF